MAGVTAINKRTALLQKTLQWAYAELGTLKHVETTGLKKHPTAPQDPIHALLFLAAAISVSGSGVQGQSVNILQKGKTLIAPLPRSSSSAAAAAQKVLSAVCLPQKPRSEPGEKAHIPFR